VRRVNDTGPSLPPIRTVGLRMQVANALREAIYSGALKAGEPLTEVALAARLNVSRGPLREAILTLEREGLVVVHPNRGATVRDLSPGELVMTLRQHLEVWALDLARQRIDAATLDQLRALFARMLAAAEAGNVREFTQLDMQFHRLFWEATSHQLLVQTLQRISGPVFAFADIALSQVNFDCRKIAELHRPILAYLSGELEASPQEVVRELFQYVYGEEWDALFSSDRTGQADAKRSGAATPPPPSASRG
jgi:DNA-binding GntR family transcriptional regulator